MDLARCELTPTKVMAQEQDDSSVEIDRLTQQLRSGNNTERNNAIIALGKMGTSAQSSLGILFVFIVIPYPEYIRVNASTSIRQIVELSESEILQLLPLLKHPNPDVRANVAAAIGKIGESFADPLYRFTLYGKEDSNPKIRVNLAAVVEQIANSDRLASLQLMPLLKDSNPLVRANTACSL
jgi:HEAT repeat protein